MSACYVARCPACREIVGACTDVPEHARDAAHWQLDGLLVETADTANGRVVIGNCRCGRRPHPPAPYVPKFDTLARYLKPTEQAGVARAAAAPDALHQSLLMTIRRLCNELARFDHALQSLTPGGSEFINNPEMCAGFADACMRSRGVRQ